MKKLILISTFLVFVFAAASFGQMLTYQIAFGAKGVDSLTGGAPAGGTAKYYYFNTDQTIAAGLTVTAAKPISNYELYAIQVNIAVPTKAADVVDSTQITFEGSNDKSNWFKWSNAGATTPATQTQYRNGGPKVSGSAVYTYLVSTRDMVTTTTTAGSCAFLPVDCIYRYYRVKITSFKASSSAYASIYVTLKKL
jgi:hypothetical protein